MKIDIDELSAQELDQLIARAARRRTQVQPEIEREPPEGGLVSLDAPSWVTHRDPLGGTWLRIRHPAFGWLAFRFVEADAALLVDALRNAPLAYGDQKRDTAGGGKHH